MHLNLWSYASMIPARFVLKWRGWKKDLVHALVKQTKRWIINNKQWTYNTHTNLWWSIACPWSGVFFFWISIKSRRVRPFVRKTHLITYSSKIGGAVGVVDVSCYGGWDHVKPLLLFPVTTIVRTVCLEKRENKVEISPTQ